MKSLLAIPPDLQPTSNTERTWSWFQYSTLWMGSVHNIPSYAAVAGFFVLGLSVYEVLVVIGCAALAIAFLMTSNGLLGAKYGVPHPVILQWIYGKHGAKVPGILRGLLAGVMWFGLQTYAGSTALYLFLTSIWPAFSTLGPSGEFLGLTAPAALCFFMFLLITLAIGWGGAHLIGPLTKLTTVCIVLIFSYLGFWAYQGAGGWSAVSDGADFTTSPLLLIMCISALTATWIAPIVSASDVTRYAKRLSAPFLGQVIGFVLTYALFSFTSISLLRGIELQFGVLLTNIVDVLPFVENQAVQYMALFTIVLATLSVNTLGNMIPAANQLTSLFPRRLTFKKSLLVLALCSTVFMPWRLLESGTSLLFFLNLLGALLAPVIGIMLAKVYFVSKQHMEVVSQDGQFSIEAPDASQARLALLVSSSIGLLCVSGSFISPLSMLYDMSVFIGLILSATLYSALTLWKTKPLTQPAPHKSLP